MITKALGIIFLLGFLTKGGDSLYCYKCHSNSGGCLDELSWFYWAEKCPEPNDICVKLVERKEAERVITRDCLSTFRGIRTDIPADRYEGCRSAAVDLKLGHYVNNSIKEQDIHRNYYDEVKWCFCYFENRCNGASSIIASAILLTLAPIFYYFTT